MTRAAAVSSGASGTNTASLPSSVSLYGSAPYSFDNTPDSETDECANISDSLQGILATSACASIGSQTFTYRYSRNIVGETGSQTQVTNVASFTSNDNHETGSDNHVVSVTVNCAVGCTLTQGYWKTHSSLGPAPYDDTWTLVGGANASFFQSGRSWIVIFRTPPAGNAYYQLAHQWMTARLNQLAGTSIPAAVQTAMTQAQTLLDQYDTTINSIPRAVQTTMRNLATILDNYNNGRLGVPHCSE